MAPLLRNQTSGPATLRSLLKTGLAEKQPVMLPGCYDALSARLVEQAGFDAVYMTGFGTTAGLIGRPDVGLLGLAEMADNARRIAAAVDIPLVADADTGYGNQAHTIRTIQEYERAGVAGLHLEDQVLPKKCGHMEDKEVVDAEIMAAKVRNAVAARNDPNFVVIARTDARAPLGLDEAIRRGHMCADAGADVLFIEALLDEAEIERVATEFEGVPLLFNYAEGGKTPPLSYDDIAALGFAMIIMPITTMLTATKAMQDVLARLKETKTPAPFVNELMSFSDFTDFMGLPEVLEIEST